MSDKLLTCPDCGEKTPPGAVHICADGMTRALYEKNGAVKSDIVLDVQSIKQGVKLNG
jgi:hypothetical protein